MAEHSPEPWYAWTGVVHVHIFDKENIDDDSPNRPIAKIEVNDYDTIEEAEADAARIVACVNACAGLNPEVVPELVGMVEALLPYAEMAQDEGPANGQGWKSDHLEVILDKARELLGRVKQ